MFVGTAARTNVDNAGCYFAAGVLYTSVVDA